MVQTVTLPFGALNALPGVSGIQDVSFDIPQLSDIRDELDQAVPSLDEIREVIQEEVDQLELGDGITVPTVEEIAEAVADRLDIPEFDGITVDIQGSLFDIESDFVDLLAAALDQADLLDVSEFPTLQELERLLEDATADLSELDIPTVTDIGEEVESRLTAVLEDTLPEWVTLDLEDLVDRLTAEVEDRLVSEEARQELITALEED